MCHPERRRHAPHCSAPADRCRGGILAVEFSDELAREKSRRRVVLRLFDHSQGFGRPAGAVQLVRAFHDAGLPPGVLNLVFGNPAEISNYLIPKSSVRLITFT